MSAIIGTNGTAFLLDLDASHEVERSILGAILLAEAYLASVGSTRPATVGDDGKPGSNPVRSLADLFRDARAAEGYIEQQRALLASLKHAPRLGRAW